jgi:hypothetical protein
VNIGHALEDSLDIEPLRIPIFNIEPSDDKINDVDIQEQEKQFSKQASS